MTDGPAHPGGSDRVASGDRSVGAAAEPPTTRRMRFVVAYDGASFHGFAPNPGVRTVLGDLTDALERIARVPLEPVGAGRTDAGVHGWGQVVTVDVPAHLDPDDLRRRLDKLCGPEIAVREAGWVSADFHARFSATSRTYRYHVWNDRSPNPLLRHQAWHVPRPLRLWALRAAADPLIGEHDFASFCRTPPPRPDGSPASTVRRLLRAEWARVDDSPLLRLEISATAFCHQMVRSIVGTMVDVGLGKRTPADVAVALAARDRAAAPTVAPPHGLVLHEVGYDGERWDAPDPAVDAVADRDVAARDRAPLS